MLKRSFNFVFAGELLCVQWNDKRAVHMLSSMHKATMSETNNLDRATGQKVSKPDVVIGYNKYMGSVDVSDFMANSYTEMRRSLKWYKKLVFYLNDVAVTNAYVLFKMVNHSNIRHVDFIVDLVEQLVADGTQQALDRPLPITAGRRLVGDVPARLMYRSSRHWPQPFAPTTKMYPSKPCVVCKPKPLGHTRATGEETKRPESRYMCPVCDVALHIHPCFQIYHTRQIYKVPVTNDSSSSDDSARTDSDMSE